MRYATAYDIGKRKREQGGINEDSIEVAVFEDGHRNGVDYPDVDFVTGDDDADSVPTVHGPGDSEEASEATAATNADNTTEVFEPGTATERDDPPNRCAGVFVLADGAGGMEAGDIASYIATTVVAQELSRDVHDVLLTRPDDFGVKLEADLFGDPLDDDDIEAAIEGAVAEANKSIVDYANEAGMGGMYTTVVVGVYVGQRLYYGWVGDSRIYVINEAHEEIAPLTKDHAKVTRLEEEGRIDEVEAQVHPDGNEITRALGGGSGDDPEMVADQTYGDIETGNVPLYREDVILLTSDGLIDAQTDYFELYREYVGSGHSDEVAEKIHDSIVTDDLIRDVVLEASSLDAAATQFVELSNEKGGKDNISLVLFADEALPPSPDPEESALPERSIEPDTELEDRKTILRETN